MNITKSNKNDPAYEAMFDALIQEVFGFSFQPWLEYELWDENYESYSIIENGRMLSNVCIFKSELLVRGEAVSAMQIGAVATTKSARGKGLSRLLMEHILQLYPNRLAYLSANPSVIDFYPKFGFRQVQTYTPTLRHCEERSNPECKSWIASQARNDRAVACKLDIDDAIIPHALQTRNTFSNLVDCKNAASIQMFHLIMQHHDNIYHLPHANALVVARQTNNKLYIADVISQNKLTLSDILPHLPFTDIETIQFGFCPDHLSVTPTWTPTNKTNDPFFIRGNWNLPEHFRFPATSET